MADALASGASEGNLVGVQVPPRPLAARGIDHAGSVSYSVRAVSDACDVTDFDNG
jgi:hypothetical protein